VASLCAHSRLAAEQRKLVELPEELWPKTIHLLRVDPSNVTTAQPKEILCPLLIALSNLAIGECQASPSPLRCFAI
jgi:hypothetical protein